MDNVINFIKLSFLPALGIQEEYFYFFLIMIALICSYLIVQPFIEWFILLNSKRLLSYIVTSLCVVSIFFILSLFIGEMTASLTMLFDIMLKGLAIFGILLILQALIQKILN